jgi:transposase
MAMTGSSNEPLLSLPADISIPTRYPYLSLDLLKRRVRSQRVKTDRRDARVLAEACRLGAYRPAHRTSPARRQLRAELTVREALVRTRARYISVIGAVLRREGVRVASGSAAAFLRRLDALTLSPPLAAAVAPLRALLAPSRGGPRGLSVR